MTTALRRLGPEDLPRLAAFWREHWGGEAMIVHGEAIEPRELQGFVDRDWRALVTYRIQGRECEIVSLDSLEEGLGVGTALLAAVTQEARAQGCRRLVLTTTNDNLRGLGFYQKRGLRFSALRPGAVDQARGQKPAIPLLGQNGIPLHDELDLAMDL